MKCSPEIHVSRMARRGFAGLDQRLLQNFTFQTHGAH